MPRARWLPMLRTAKTATKISCAALFVAVALLAGIILAVRSVPARAVSIGQLQQQISAGQSKVSGLAGVVGVYNGRLARLDASIARLQAELSRLQADLNAKEAELIKLE